MVGQLPRGFPSPDHSTPNTFYTDLNPSLPLPRTHPPGSSSSSIFLQQNFSPSSSFSSPMEPEPQTFRGLHIDDMRRPSTNMPLNIIIVGHPFLCTEIAECYDELTFRGITSGRGVSLPADYHQYLMVFLERQGWSSLTTLKSNVYPMLVRLFYANLAYRELQSGETIPCSWVKSTCIDISEDKLAAMLNVPNTGEKIYFTDPSKIEHYAGMSLDAYHATFCTSPVVAGQLSSNDIQSRYRLLKHYLALSILPRSGHGNEVETFLGFMIHCLVIGRKLCLPYIMQRVMLTCMDYGKIPKSLPYGAILTQIFESYGVSCNTQEDMHERTKRNIDKTSANKISGFPPGQTRSSSTAETSTRRRASTSDTPRPQIPATVGNPVESSQDGYLAAFRQDMTTRMDAMETKMDLLHSNMNAFTTSFLEEQREARVRAKDMEEGIVNRIINFFKKSPSTRPSKSTSSSSSRVPDTSSRHSGSRGGSH